MALMARKKVVYFQKVVNVSLVHGRKRNVCDAFVKAIKIKFCGEKFSFALQICGENYRSNLFGNTILPFLIAYS